MTTEQVLVRDVFEALAKNGFAHIRGSWFTKDIESISNSITGGCPLQQASMNLGVHSSGIEYSIYAQLNMLKVDKRSKWSKSPITDESVEDWNVADAIISWNDAYKDYWDEEGFFRRKWVLPTYEDVVKMAAAVMEPHMDKLITLNSMEWNYKRLPNAANA